MKRTIYIISAVFALISAAFAFKENVVLQLIFMIAVLGIFVSFILAVIHLKRRWSVLRWKAIMPLAICLLAITVPAHMAQLVRDAYFQSIIPDLESELPSIITNGEPAQTRWRGYGVTPLATASGDTAVTFWWGSGFPVKHTALVYCPVDDPKDYFQDHGWRRGYSLRENWWVVRD
jgi:hypothetical protein